MKIICIARNYREHIRELDGNDHPPQQPVFFLKPDTALLRNNDPFYIPSFSDQVDYETELVVRINRVAKHIEERFAYRCYDEVGLGIDFTARDLQRRCMADGLPWEISKAFDKSAAISPRMIQIDRLGVPLSQAVFEMRLNGEIRQKATVSEMIFGIDRIISYVSRFMTLKIGDLIYTGTPQGVGPVRPGDRINAMLQNEPLLDFEIK